MTKAVFDSLSVIHDVPLILNTSFSDDEFFVFCRLNAELRIERDAEGTIHIMPPTGFDTGNFNSEINGDLILWNRIHRNGRTGESNTGYILPNGATRSPDSSWVSNERLAEVPKDSLKKFAPLCPDFVIEIRSPSDSLSKLKAKMVEYIENGCRLGWLIDKEAKQVFIYRQDGSISVIKSFDEKLSGENVLPGFEICLSDIPE